MDNNSCSSQFFLRYLPRLSALWCGMFLRTDKISIVMKTLKMLAAAAVICSVVACNSNKPSAKTNGADSTAVASTPAETVNPKSLIPSKALTDSVSYLMGINFGSFIKGYNFGDKLNFNEIKKGMNDFIKAKGNQRDTSFLKQFKISPEEMNRLFGAYIDKMNEYTAAVNKQDESKFFASNKSKPGVQETASGLQYVIKEAGNDVKPGPKDTVFVHYKGTLTNGDVFDESPAEGPSVMLLMDRVVKGWTEGLQLLGEGGKATLYVPSELGYGARGNQGIAPNSTLVFDVQLDSVKRFTEPVVEPAK